MGSGRAARCLYFQDTGTCLHSELLISDVAQPVRTYYTVFLKHLPVPSSSSSENSSRQTNRPQPSPSSGEPSEPRPLPTPPSMPQDQSQPKFSTLQHSTSPSEPHWISDTTPSSPPPPYSRFLPPENPYPIPTTRDLSRVPLSTPPMPVPTAPVIMPSLPEARSDNDNSNTFNTRAPHDSFLCHSPSSNSWITVETSQSEYVLLINLPGFRHDGITIATKRRRILHVVADSWEPEGGHFERRVSFGYDADLAQVRAEFDGDMLRIIVPRRLAVAAS